VGFYESLRDGTVSKLITQYGQAVTLKVPSAGTFNAETGGFTAGAEASYTTVGVADAFFKSEKGGSNVKTKRLKVYLSPADLAVEPTTSHRIVVSGVEYDIVSVKPVAPGGIVVLYELDVVLP
jgi:hypothetical protein